MLLSAMNISAKWVFAIERIYKVMYGCNINSIGMIGGPVITGMKNKRLVNVDFFI